ncbi:MAG: radical SAM protein [Proteobacteria bacterium]|nr:radical SAM protein [Pseudomonadota bacterium]
MDKYRLDSHKLMYHPVRVAEFVKTGDCYPIYMEISPVGLCNHRCIFCAYDFIGHPNRRLDTERTLHLIDELADCGINSLVYAGEGEPLLHPDIHKFISHSKNRGIDVGLFTNGHLLKPEKAASILPFLTFIRFSFNGGNRDNYSQMHQVSASVYDRVVENIRFAVKTKNENNLNLDIGVQFVLLPENIDYLLQAIYLFKDIGVDYFVVKPFVLQSEHQSYAMPRQLSHDELKPIFNEAEQLSDNDYSVLMRHQSFVGYGNRDYDHCFGTCFVSVLTSGGDVATCLPYWDKQEFIFGNIYKSSFSDIWNGEVRKKIKHSLENELDVTNLCPPNCRPHAINRYLWELKTKGVKHINFI